MFMCVSLWMCVLVCIGLYVYLYLYSSVHVCVYVYVFIYVGVREGVRGYVCGIYLCGHRSVYVWSVYSCACVSVCLLCAYLCVCMYVVCMCVCVYVCYRPQINRSEAELIVLILLISYGSYYLDSASDFWLSNLTMSNYSSHSSLDFVLSSRIPSIFNIPLPPRRWNHFLAVSEMWPIF